MLMYISKMLCKNHQTAFCCPRLGYPHYAPLEDRKSASLGEAFAAGVNELQGNV